MIERLSGKSYMEARPQPTVLVVELSTTQAELLIQQGKARIPTRQDLTEADYEPKPSTVTGEKTVVAIDAAKVATLGDLQELGL